MGIVDFFGSFFGGPKVKPDYPAELEKVKKDYAELRELIDECRKLPLLGACQKRLDALNNENYHPVVLLIVSHPVKEFHDAVKYYIERLELAVQGDVEAIKYIEKTKKEIFTVLDSYKTRLVSRIKDVNWPVIKTKILSDIETQKRVLKLYIPKGGKEEEENKREWFTEERLKSLKSNSLSLPARLVWTLARGQVHIDRYLNLLDQLIAADEEHEKKLISDLKNLEAVIEVFLSDEFDRITNKYAKILSGQGGLP